MSLTYLLGHDHLVADWVVATKIASGHASTWAGFNDKNLRAIGILNEAGYLIAGLVYYDLKPDAGTIEFSAEAIPRQRWLTPTTLAIMFQYPFLQCGCQMLLTKISARSLHVKRMLEAMNFECILIPRSGGRHEDGYICLLTFESWLESKFTKRYGHAKSFYKTEEAA